MDDPLDPAALDALGGLVQHDVVAPLVIVGHLLDSIAERDLPPDVLPRLAAVTDGVVRTIGHGERLAALLRLPPATAPVPVRLPDLVDETVTGVVADVPPVSLVADVARLTGVLDELLGFAVIGGTTSHVTVTAVDTAGGVALTVRDDGEWGEERRRHEHGSLCLARTARIVGADVEVRALDRGLHTRTVLPPHVAVLT